MIKKKETKVDKVLEDKTVKNLSIIAKKVQTQKRKIALLSNDGM